MTATLQTTSESLEARCAACDVLLQMSKNDSTCATLCSVGGIHAVVNALKNAVGCAPLLKALVRILHNFHRFDSKLTSIVVRLQDGIGALLDGLREHMHCTDDELLHGLLGVLNEVSHNGASIQAVVNDNGTAVVLASVLAHLKTDTLLLPALNLLVAISRQPAHVPTLVREGGVPAVLAAILAHLRRVEVLRAALFVLRNIVADDRSAVRLGGQGAYRIVFAVLQTHAACVEQIELIKLASAVLWRIHHARHPPASLLHSQLAFTRPVDPLATGPCKETGLRSDERCGSGQAGAGGGGGNSVRASDEEEDAGDSEEDVSPSAPPAFGARPSMADGVASLGIEPLLALTVPHACFKYGGHASFIEASPTGPEPLSASRVPGAHAELVARAIMTDAEHLMAVPMPRSPETVSPPHTDSAMSFPRVVYDAYPASGQARWPVPFDGSLRFDGQFESANLRRAVQVGGCEYNLVLNCDVNTRGHTQWFFFRVNGMKANLSYRLNIINFMKCDSLFSSGMRPLLYSERVAEVSQIGWSRCGDDVVYFQNQYCAVPVLPKRPPPTKKGLASSREASTASLYTLSFLISFPHTGDTAYISQCYPFTYSMQQRGSRHLCDAHSAAVRRETLCRSYGGNHVDLLTVSDFTCTTAEFASRKVAVISARVHPGETNASWMMKGLLEAATADTPDAQLLRRNVILKIVPILNPDGVILGNYRCSVSGFDLNRQWSDPNEVTSPTIYHLKRLMKSFVASEQLLLFCDLHGHSRKRNIFAYGCETTRGPSRLRERVFPRLLADCGHFSLAGCSFKVLKSKENTGRVVVWRHLLTPNSFTLEASFCGADSGTGQGSHFSTFHLKEMGAAFVPALVDFVDPAQVRVGAVMAELETEFPAAVDDDAEEDVDGTDRADGADEKIRRPVARGRYRLPQARGCSTIAPVARRKPVVDLAAAKKKKKPVPG